MKSQVTLLVLVVAVFAIHLTFGIKCYQCENCEQPKKEDLKECRGEEAGQTENINARSVSLFSCESHKIMGSFIRACAPRKNDGCETSVEKVKICYCNTDGCNKPEEPTTPGSTGSPLTSPTFLLNLLAILTFFGFLFI